MRGVPTRPPGKKTVRIWADADACTPACIQALFAAAQRHSMLLTLISTTTHAWPHSAFIRTVVVGEGYVSPRLQELAMTGDLAVTADAALLKTLEKSKIATLKPDGKADLPARLEDLLLDLHQILERESLAITNSKTRKGAAEPAASSAAAEGG